MTRRSPAASWLLLAVLATAGAVVALSPGATVDGVLMALAGPTLTIAVLVGVRVHRPARPAPWYGLAFTGAFMCAGDVTITAQGAGAPYPSLADGLWLTAYLGMFFAVRRFLRAGGGGRDRAAALDAGIVAVAATTLSWTFLMSSYANDDTLSAAAKAVSMAYVVADLALLTGLMRLAFGNGPGGASARLLMGGFVGMVAADMVYGHQGLAGTYVAGAAVDGAFVTIYGCLAAAALHPSMRRLTEPLDAEPDLRLAPWRLAVLGCAALVVPVVQVLVAVTHRQTTVVALGAGSAVLFGLVCLRLGGLMHQQAAAREREAILRRAGEELVTARSPAGIETILVATAEVLTGRRGLRVATADEEPVGGWSLPVGLRQDHPSRLCGPGSAPAPEIRRALQALVREAALALEAAASLQEAARRSAEARLAALISHGSDIVCVVLADGTCTFVSPSIERVLGHAPDRVAGHPIHELTHADDARRARAFLAAVARSPGAAPQSAEFRVRHADGSWRDVEVLGANLLADPAVEGVVLNVREISERKALERELAHRAFHDGLTGLPNRALFRDRVEHALERAPRDGRQVAVLFLDLDDLKWVNDSLGHGVGDALLCEVARRLEAQVRSVDTVARLGGDEYAVLLDGSGDERHAVTVAERLLASLAPPMDLEGHVFQIRASLGVAHAADGLRGGDGAEVLLRNADAAMYVAKAEGKGRYRVFEQAMHDEAVDRQALKGDLERAVRDGELVLAYQPIVELATGRIASVEALVRWRHPERGIVPPAQFIPLAEETGLVVPIGAWVLREACAHAARLQAAAPHDPPVGVSVNLSARQLQRPDVVDDVRAALEASGIPPASLTLELTETLLVEDVDLAVLRLHEVRATGVQLAIDDFGTGYSSLTYLRHFPLDVLKVDKSFIDDIRVEGGTGPLTASILDLARVLGLRAVAEGIETDAQADVLRGFGCEYGQGYALYRPLDADAVLAAVVSAPGRPLPAARP